MTKQEAKETLERILRINGPINLGNYEDAIEVAIKALSSPSIPAPTFNLDAEIADYIENERYIPDDEVYIVKEIAEKFYKLGLKEKSEIPTNLEEAAREYCSDTNNVVLFTEGDNESELSDEDYIERAFKAGAEWREQQIPKLPDNLKEAAEEFAEGEWDGLHDSDGNALYTQDYAEYAFKAGAEWMAGQYETLGETEIHLEDNGDEPPHNEEWLDLATTEFRIPDNTRFKDGDKVIVQIRKK